MGYVLTILVIKSYDMKIILFMPKQNLKKKMLLFFPSGGEICENKIIQITLKIVFLR